MELSGPGFRLLRRLGRSFIARSFFVSRQIRQVNYISRIRLEPVRVRRHFGLLLTLPVTFIPSVMAASGEDNKALIDESEELYDKKEFKAMYELLMAHKDSKDANVMWRLARAATERGKCVDVGKEDKKTLTFEAFEYAKRALELDDNNFACHKWVGILLNYTDEYIGTKKRIEDSMTVKGHFLKAIELNPKDATTMHCLGVWCYSFAALAWYERKIAAVLFGSPPTSSYEEALEFFLKAEEAEPLFYSPNLLMIGRSYLELKNNEKAIEYFKKILNYKVLTEEDNQTVSKAKAHLKSLKVELD